jgi:hypothetical protein
LKTNLLFYFLFFIHLQSYSQTNATVSGFLRDQNNQPLINGSLHFDHNNNYSIAITDSLGFYSILLPFDNYEITISQDDFTTQKVVRDITKNTILNFSLNSRLEELQEVVIATDTKRIFLDSNPNILAFKPKDLKSVPFIMGTTDVMKFLQLTPGVQNSGDANGYFYVRGSDPGHNLTLYSNTPIYGTAHLLGVFPFFNADHIQKVQFDKSNSNPENGGRLSSAVRIETNDKIPEKLSVSGVVGVLASQITLALPLNKKIGFYVSGRKTYIDEIVTPLFNSKKKSKNSDVKDLSYGFSDFNYTLIVNPNPKSQFVLDAFWSGDKLNIKDDNLALDAKLYWNNLSVSSSWKHKISPLITMKNTVYRSRYGNDLSLNQATAQIKGVSTIQDFGFLNSFQYTIGKIPFESGFQFATYKLQPQKIEVYNLSLDADVNESKVSKSQNTSLFTSAKPQFSKSLFAEIGLRLNYYLSNDKKAKYFHFEPRIQINYVPDADKSVFVSYTKQHQYLNLITTSSVGIPTDFWVASTEGIPAQSSNEFSIGGKYRIFSKFIINSSLYYRSMNNLLEYPFGITQFNEISSFKEDIKTGKGQAYGMEWMFQKEIGKFKGWVSYTLSWSTRKFDEINNGNTYFAKYDRRHNLAIVATYALNSKWDFGMTQMVSSGNRFTIPTSWYFINNNPVKEYGAYNNAQLPSYVRTDFSVNYYFLKNSNKESVLNFSVFNAFNIQNPIYVVLNVEIDKEKQKVEVKPERKQLYSILPSVSWRFKF